MSNNDPWRHRSAGMQCQNCMWFVRKVRTATEDLQSDEPLPAPVLGRCWRHEPTMSGYPAVFEHDWCEDHRLDENAIV